RQRVSPARRRRRARGPSRPRAAVLQPRRERRQGPRPGEPLGDRYARARARRAEHSRRCERLLAQVVEGLHRHRAAIRGSIRSAARPDPARAAPGARARARAVRTALRCRGRPLVSRVRRASRGGAPRGTARRCELRAAAGRVRRAGGTGSSAVLGGGWRASHARRGGGGGWGGGGGRGGRGGGPKEGMGRGGWGCARGGGGGGGGGGGAAGRIFNNETPLTGVGTPG